MSSIIDTNDYVGTKLIKKIEIESDQIVTFLFRNLTAIERREMHLEEIEDFVEISIFEEELSNVIQNHMSATECCIKEHQNELLQAIKRELYSSLKTKDKQNYVLKDKE